MDTLGQTAKSGIYDVAVLSHLRVFPDRRIFPCRNARSRRIAVEKRNEKSKQIPVIRFVRFSHSQPCGTFGGGVFRLYVSFNALELFDYADESSRLRVFTRIVGMVGSDFSVYEIFIPAAPKRDRKNSCAHSADVGVLLAFHRRPGRFFKFCYGNVLKRNKGGRYALKAENTGIYKNPANEFLNLLAGICFFTRKAV